MMFRNGCLGALQRLAGFTGRLAVVTGLLVGAMVAGVAGGALDGGAVASASTVPEQPAATVSTSVYSCSSPVYAQPKAPAGHPVTVSAHLGGVSATLTGTAVKGDGGGFNSVLRPVLRISLAGGRSWDHPVPEPPDAFTGGPFHGGLLLNPVQAKGDYPVCLAQFGPHKVTVALVGTFTGGAHCCSWVYAYPATPAGAAMPKPVQYDAGDPGVTVEKVGTKAIVRTADDRFAYAFDAFAMSGLPTKVLEFQYGRFVDTTRQHLLIVANDAEQWWSAYQQATRGKNKGGGLGLLAPWVADQCVLGHSSQAWSTVNSLEAKGLLDGGQYADPSVWPTGAKYVTALHKFLAKTGYCAG